jgi:UPF0176 protein
MMIVVAAFYQFVPLPDCAEWQVSLLEHCTAQGIKGTILLATEGINGTIAGSRQAIDAILSLLRADPRLADLQHKESLAATMPFDRLKVRLKPEIVTFGQPVDPTVQVGTYVDPQDWNALMADPDVIVIDTRNDFEVSIGSFKGAENPKTQSFREFPEFVRDRLDPKQHSKIALFCTGGIRCEKASSFLLAQGFSQVYHLKGGILNYLEQVPVAESLWQGECFVFDQRVAVQHGLELGTHQLCFSCGNPIAIADTTLERQPEQLCPQCGDR